MSVRSRTFLVLALLAAAIAGCGLAARAQAQARIFVFPKAATIGVNETKQFTATYDPFTCAELSGCPGLQDVSAQAAWSISDLGVLAPAGQGVFRGLRTGTATITARYQSLSGTAAVTVGSATPSPPTPGPSGQGGLVLEKTLLEMPGYASFRGNSAALGIAEWLTGGYFVISGGNCHQNSEDHGTWVFRPDGTLVQERHNCEDALAAGDNPDGLNLWAHAWALSPNIAAVNGTQFVRQGAGISGGHPYPPMLYEARSSSVALLAKLFNLRSAATGGNPPASYNLDTAPRIGPLAVARNRMVVQVAEGSKTYNAMYALPAFTLVKKWDNFGTSASGFPVLLNPIVGIGDYIVASKGFVSTDLYRVRDSDLEFVEKLFDGSAAALLTPVYSRDTSNPNRIALRDAQGKVHAYAVGSNGFTELPLRNISPGAFAISGERSAQTFAGATGCGIEVYQGDQKIASGILPQEDFGNGSKGPAPCPSAMVFTPDGTKLLSVSPFGAYLYRIVPGQNSGPGPGACDANPFDPACLPGGGGTTTLPQMPGQNFSIIYSTSSTSSVPSVLIRFANVLSVGSASLNIQSFGRNYTVDAANAQVLNSSWAPTTLNEFSLTGFANVWGSLDAANPTMIHAFRVRNPVPANITGQFTQSSSASSFSAGTSFGSGTTGITGTTATMQTKLDALQAALKALQLQLGQ